MSTNNTVTYHVHAEVLPSHQSHSTYLRPPEVGDLRHIPRRSACTFSATQILTRNSHEHLVILDATKCDIPQSVTHANHSPGLPILLILTHNLQLPPDKFLVS